MSPQRAADWLWHKNMCPLARVWHRHRLQYWAEEVGRLELGSRAFIALRGYPR